MTGLVGAVFGRPMCRAAAAPARQKRIGVLMEYTEGGRDLETLPRLEGWAPPSFSRNQVSPWTLSSQSGKINAWQACLD
jgi:hypothetical protein